MAQKVTPYVEDDLTGEALMDEPGTTIRFDTMTGKSLEFDASEVTVVKFHETRDAALAAHKHAMSCAKAAYYRAVFKAGENYDAKLADYIAVARKSSKGKRKSKSSGSYSTVEREANQAIREAARASGIEVSKHGRISENVKAQFSHAAS